MSATTTAVANGPAALDERRQIEAAADEYESMRLDDDDEPAVLLSGLKAAPKAIAFPHDDVFDSTSDRLDERRTSSRSTSSTSSNAEDVDEVMAHDRQSVRDPLTISLDDALASEASGTLERHFSSVSLGDRESVISVAMDDKPLAVDVSRAIMFNRYARAVPSAQESQSFAASTCLRPKEMTLSVATGGSLLATASVDCCCSTSCREQAKWKDERVHELQRALDLMVDAMAIQQRDMAAQRAFLAHQSEQLTKLSVTLHQEKLHLQIEKERVQKAMRAATCSPSSTSSSATSSCRPPTPSGSSSRTLTPRGVSANSSKPKTSMKAVFSTLTGSPSSRTNSSSGRRCTVSLIDEHTAIVSPQVADLHSVAASSARSASTSQLTQVLPVSSRDTTATSSFSDMAASRTDATTVAAEFERSVSLSVLELRTTQPTPSSSGGKAQMSDVSLQDSPVRFGSRSATNCVVSKERTKDTATSSSGDAAVGTAVAAAVSPTSSGGESKKPSLGDRFRSLRWKA